MNGYVKVRVKATGQVIDMIPDAARARILGGTVERVTESGMVTPAAERAVTPAQAGPAPRKTNRRSA